LVLSHGSSVVNIEEMFEPLDHLCVIHDCYHWINKVEKYIKEAQKRTLYPKTILGQDEFNLAPNDEIS